MLNTKTSLLEILHKVWAHQSCHSQDRRMIGGHVCCDNMDTDGDLAGIVKSILHQIVKSSYTVIVTIILIITLSRNKVETLALKIVHGHIQC